MVRLFQIELEDPLENVGVKLVRQAGAKTNDLAGDGSTTSVVLAHGLIKEGAKVNITNLTFQFMLMPQIILVLSKRVLLNFMLFSFSCRLLQLE